MLSKIKAIAFGTLSIVALYVAPTVFAQQPDGFLIEIEPTNFDVNVPVDMTIKAVKGNSEIVKEYEGDVFIDVVGTIDTVDYVVPSEGLYTFLAQDQGVKLFSKGLVIKKAGTYTVVVSDITNDSVKGEKTIVVGGQHQSADLEKIDIVRPLPGSTEKSEMMNVFGSSKNLPNSPVEIYLNDALAIKDTTDNNGSFSVYVKGLLEGENTIQARIVDVNQNILGESEITRFTFAPLNDGTFNGIEIVPGNKVKQGTKVLFKVTTSEVVTSASLQLSNGRGGPMTMDSAGNFSKEIMLDTEGTIKANLELIVGGQKKTYPDVTSVTVEKGAGIGKIRIYTDTTDPTKVNLTWEIIGNATKYKIFYGTEKENLTFSDTVNTTEWNVNGLELEKTYYFKIQPLDDNDQDAGAMSDIVEITVGEQEPNCSIKGIQIRDEKIGDKYYITWSGVINVEKYVIYRGDTETSDINQMQKVGETSDTKFEYPFNRASKEEKFAYYTVEAICTDGKAVLMDNVKKVQTGPLENIMLVAFISLLIYGLTKMYRYSNQ